MSTKNKTTDTVIEQSNPDLNQHQKENLPVFKNDNNLINKRNPKPQERQINNNITNRTETGIKPREHIPPPSKSDTPSIFTEPKNYVSSSPKNTSTRLTSYSSKMILGESTNTACNIASSTDNSQNTTVASIQTTTTTTTPSYIPSHSQKERNVKHSTINLKSEMISVDLKPQSQINFGNYIENLNNSTLNLSNTINLTSNSTSHNVNVTGNPSVPVTTPSGSVTDLSSSIPKSHHTDYQFQNEGSSVYQQSLYSVNLNTNNFPQLTSTANNNNNLNSSTMNLDPSSTISNISPSNQGMTNANHVTATGLGVTTNNNSTVNSTGVNPFNRVKSKKSKGGYYNNDNDEDEEFRYYDSSSINNNTTEIHSQQDKRHTRKLSIRSTVTSNFDLESVYIPPSSNYHHPPRSPHAPSFAGNSRDYYTTNQNMLPVSASNQNINNAVGNNGYGPSNSQYLATTPKLNNDFGPFVQNDDQFDNRSTNSYDFNTSSNNDMIQMPNQRIRPTHRSSRATLNNGTNTLFADNGYNSKYWHSDHMRSPTSTSVNVSKQGANMQSNNKMNDPLQSYPNSNTIISQVRQVSQRLFSSNRIGLKKEISNPQINYNSNSNFGHTTSSTQTTGRIYSSIHSFNPGSPTRSTGGNELSLNSDQYSIAETVCIKKSPSKIKKGKNKKNVNDKKKKQQRGDRILSKVDSKDGNRTLTSYKLNDSNNENLETTLEDISNVDDNSIVAKGQDLTESSINFDHEAVLTNNDNEENEEDDENEDDGDDDDDDDENDLDSVEESSEDEEERLYLNHLLVIDEYERRSGSTRSAAGTANRSFSVNQYSVNGYDNNYDNNNSKGKANGGGSGSRYLHNNPKDLDIFDENQQRKDNYSRNSNIEDRRSTNFINPNIEQNISNESLNLLANRYCNSYGSAYDSDDFQFFGLSSNQNPKEFYRQKSGNYHSPHGIEDQENHGKGRSIRRQNGRVQNRQSYDFNSPHNYKSIYYRTNLILRILSLVFYFSLILLFLILLGKFFILKNFHNKLDVFTINKIDNILISDEMLVFDIFTSTRNINVQDVVINDVDVDVFLVTEHYNDKIKERKKNGAANTVEKTTILLGNTKQLSTPLEFKGILSSSSALSLSSELSKVWYYINHKNEIIPVNSKGQIKITDPGKTTRDKLQASGNALGILDIGDDKWHNIINHKFTLIMRGSLTYHLTVINDDEIMGISYSTIVHGQTANDSLVATNNLDI